MATFHGHALLADADWAAWKSACMPDSSSANADVCQHLTDTIMAANKDIFI